MRPERLSDRSGKGPPTRSETAKFPVRGGLPLDEKSCHIFVASPELCYGALPIVWCFFALRTV